MSLGKCQSNLKEAIDLLDLLGSLSEVFSQDASGELLKTTCPWSGIKLTLRDIKERVIVVEQLIKQEDARKISAYCENEELQVKEVVNLETSIKSKQTRNNLLNRIQKSPVSAGKVRGLSLNVSDITMASETKPFCVQGTASGNIIEDFDSELSI